MKTLPRPKFYTVRQLARKWNCDPQDVLDHAREGSLKLSVLSEGWRIECGGIEKDDNGLCYIPMPEYFSSGQLLNLSLCSTRGLIKDGLVKNPSFVCKGYGYANISSSLHQEEITVSIKDILIDPEDALEFEGLCKGTQESHPIAPAALRKLYKSYIKENESKGAIPSWKKDQEVMTKALGKKPTDKQIKQIRAEEAPKHWTQRGRRKKSP